MRVQRTLRGVFQKIGKANCVDYLISGSDGSAVYSVVLFKLVLFIDI